MFADLPDGTVDRTSARCGNFRRHSTAAWKTCGCSSPCCPQDRLDAASAGGHDCGHDWGTRDLRRRRRAGRAADARSTAPTASADPRASTRHESRRRAGDDEGAAARSAPRLEFVASPWSPGRPCCRTGLQHCSRSISTSGAYGAFIRWAYPPRADARSPMPVPVFSCSSVAAESSPLRPGVGGSWRGRPEGWGIGSRPICRRTRKRFLRSGLPSARFLSHSSSPTA